MMGSGYHLVDELAHPGFARRPESPHHCPSPACWSISRSRHQSVPVSFEPLKPFKSSICKIYSSELLKLSVN
ncbi:MAG: hypothetical protein ABI835_00310, partial [Chloroflexota bacterium]